MQYLGTIKINNQHHLRGANMTLFGVVNGHPVYHSFSTPVRCSRKFLVGRIHGYVVHLASHLGSYETSQVEVEDTKQLAVCKKHDEDADRSPKDPGTVDGRNLAPVDMVNIPLFIGFHTSQVVQDFSHQQYDLRKGLHKLFWGWDWNPKHPILGRGLDS